MFLTSENFAENVFTTNSHKLTIVQFTANWCSSCQEFQPTLEQLKGLYPNDTVVFAKVDVDQYPELADQYNVDKLPTFLFFKNRNIINFIIGNESINQFKRMINDILNK
jgi:thioredoxin 1